MAPREVVFRPTPTGGILLDLGTSACFRLNRVGAAVWEQLVAGRDFEAIVDSIGATYRVDREIVSADVGRLCEELSLAGLLPRPAQDLL